MKVEKKQISFNFEAMNNSSHILVTGGAGYIGSHTVVQLIENGYTPIIVDDLRNAHKNALDGIEKITGKKIIHHPIDVCDLKALKKVFALYPFLGIIHFAAYKAVGESVEQPLKYYRNNILGLLNILEMAQEFDVKNIVFSSSCTVYGEPKNEIVVNEKSPIQIANSPYGNTKQIGEEIIQDFIKSGVDCKVLNLRYFNPVGAHPSSLIGEFPIGKPNNLMPVITQTAIGKLPKITIFGNDYNTIDGTCVRDYIHVVDVAEAHVKGINWLLKQNESLVEVLNIGTGKGTSVLELVHTFEEIAGQKLNWEFGPRRKGDVVEIFADVTKMFNLMSWKPNKTVKDAVIDAWNWEQKLNNDKN